MPISYMGLVVEEAIGQAAAAAAMEDRTLRVPHLKTRRRK